MHNPRRRVDALALGEVRSYNGYKARTIFVSENVVGLARTVGRVHPIRRPQNMPDTEGEGTFRVPRPWAGKKPGRSPRRSLGPRPPRTATAPAPLMRSRSQTSRAWWGWSSVWAKVR